MENAESVNVKLEETPLKTFDEIFGDGWWDKGEAAEDFKGPAPTNFGQNVRHQIDRQNTQIGQIEPNSTDQNPLLTASDHSENAKNGLNRKVSYEKEERKHLVEKFDQRKAELKRDGFKNSYKHEIDETVAKELGLNFKTIYKWKRKLGQAKPNKYPHSKQKELMKRYYQIKDKNSKISDKDIAKKFKIGTRTLCNWKKQFDRQQFYPNSVDSVEENAGSNVQEIGGSNSESI
uniref:Transposase n=1 Tax=Globodera rostochiensis TaxID=31243 RepID=A0A914HBF5_GLORO